MILHIPKETRITKCKHMNVLDEHIVSSGMTPVEIEKFMIKVKGLEIAGITSFISELEIKSKPTLYLLGKLCRVS